MAETIKLYLSLAALGASLVYAHYAVNKWAFRDALEEWSETERLCKSIEVEGMEL